MGEYANRYFLLSQDMYRQREDWQIDHPQKPFPEPGIEWRESIVEKTWNVLETGFHVASNHLPINDVIRLFLSYEYCCFLWKHGGEPQEAKATAMQVYEDASALSFELTVDQLLILGKIREELLISKQPRSLLQAYGENDEDDVSENQDGGEEMAKLDSFRVTRKKSVKFAQLDKLRESRWNVGVFNHNLEVATLIKKYLGPGISCPTYLESIPSSSIILKTVDKIFRAYIRGNALPGQQTSGNTVDLAGHNISFGAFLLNGPYMSWKGFLQFLMDFGVVKLPSQQSKHGQKFWKTMSILQVNPDDAAVSDTNSATGGNSQVEPVLTLKEAALIFIQSSCAGHSALISRRTNNQRTHDNDDKGKGLNPDHVEAESWQLVTQWAENDGDSEWEIDVGTNFSQFLDCLGVSCSVHICKSEVDSFTVYEIFL
jgi:hypothetical protein